MAYPPDSRHAEADPSTGVVSRSRGRPRWGCSTIGFAPPGKRSDAEAVNPRPTGPGFEEGLSTISSTKLSTRERTFATAERRRSFDSGGPSPEPESGPVVQAPAAVGSEFEALERVVGEQQIAVEVDPVGERRDRGRGADPDRRLLHAAEEGPEAELPGPSEHPAGGADAAGLGELDVDPGHDPDERVQIIDRDRALVGDDRQWRALLEAAKIIEATRGERLLLELDAELDELREQRNCLVK